MTLCSDCLQYAQLESCFHWLAMFVVYDDLLQAHKKYLCNSMLIRLHCHKIYNFKIVMIFYRTQINLLISENEPLYLACFNICFQWRTCCFWQVLTPTFSRCLDFVYVNSGIIHNDTEHGHDNKHVFFPIFKAVNPSVSHLKDNAFDQSVDARCKLVPCALEIPEYDTPFAKNRK